MTPYPPRTPRRPSAPPPTEHPAPTAVLANVLGLLLLIGGAAAVLTAAWLTDPLFGLAATGAAATLAGWRLATTEA